MPRKVKGRWDRVRGEHHVMQKLFKNEIGLSKNLARETENIGDREVRTDRAGPSPLSICRDGEMVAFGGERIDWDLTSGEI